MHHRKYEQLNVNNLYQHIQDLHYYIHQLLHYVSETNIYEYHIQKINIEKVKGTLQLGQLLEEAKNDLRGTHRLIIKDLQINEIEEHGTVGIGVTEKENNQQKQLKKVSPQEASKETKNIYEEIQTLLAIDQVPHFFQALASKQNVLKTVWTITKKTWNSNEAFNDFYTDILRLLNDIPMPTFDPSVSKLDHHICITVANHIELCAKTLFIIIYLIHFLLPHFLNAQQKKQHISPKHFTIHVHHPQKGVTSDQYLTAIKNGVQLDELPPSYNQMNEFPDVITALHDAFVNELTPQTNPYNEYVKHMHKLFTSETADYANESLFVKLNPDEVGFLCARLIDDFTTYQKHIFLDYLLLPLCNKDA